MPFPPFLPALTVSVWDGSAKRPLVELSHFEREARPATASLDGPLRAARLHAQGDEGTAARHEQRNGTK
jgi:hypothetical protein